ncbi:hypothetical protein RND81_13G218200 [Saponaria officinalis]|uniref:RING-type E3 ubiquitin transferase n=1 Tax=Saponaria officinalis TaxID=3572 RepID=A0AAW1H3G0_SAPOF
MAEPPIPSAGLRCIFTHCDKTTHPCAYVIACENISPPPPPPPMHPLAAAAQSRMAPFLIATVCILGISFLLLTTCTIILRWRFTRHRRRGGNSSADAPDDGDDGADHSVVDHPIWHITTVGLQQSVIDSITAFKYKKLDHFLTDKSECTVCLTEFEEDDDLRLLPKCSHAFHMSCIDVWLRSHKNCPLCRAPVVNEGFTGTNFGARSDRWSNRQDTPLRDSEIIGESSSGDTTNDSGELPVQGIRIAEILNKNGGLRVHSDLGVYYRFKRVDEEECVLEPIKRSLSFNAVAAASCISKVNEGLCYSTSGGGNAACAVQEMKIDIEDGAKRGTSMSGLLLMKTSSIAPSLQKGSVSMKRSMSSGSKLFSFRRTKSQASILPL